MPFLRDRGCLLAILVLAAALRLYGIGHGLPFVYNPDEANIMARALSVARSLDPEYYLYPSFFFYFLFAVEGGLFLSGRIVGRYPSLSAFEARFFQDPTDFYLAGRIVVVVLSLATIVLLERLVSRHFGKVAGRAAAFFIAVAYFHARDSHYLKHDVPAAFLVALFLWATDRALSQKGRESYLLAGFVLGVAFATHYYLIILAPAFVVCHLVTCGRGELSRLLAAGAASAATFFLLSPFVILRLPTALEHMRANRQVVLDRSLAGGFGLFPSLGRYVEFLLGQGLGYALTALVVAGFILIARRGVRALVLWAGFPLLFFAFVCYTFFAGRYMNPILPCLAAAAGVAVSAIGGRFGMVAATVASLAAAIQPLYRAVHVNRLFASEDTRTLARGWILANLPRGGAVALQSYSVPLPQSKESFRESLAANEALAELHRTGKYAHLLRVAEKENPSYRLVFLGKGDELNRIYVGYEALVPGLDPLRALGVTAVVLRHPPIPPPPELAALFSRVKAEGRLLASISPFRGAPATPYLDNEDWPPGPALTHKGPLVEIWSLEDP
jgi:4-amino-4-deoxy-L-arabinose transferase-like glycosyltransferase